MTRALRPCGTEAAYKRHQRAGERPCADCMRAHRAEQRQRDRGARTAAPLAILPPVAPAEAIDRLDQARWALQACTSAIEADSPGMASLLREHTRLVDLVATLEAASRPDENPLRRLLREKGIG